MTKKIRDNIAYSGVLVSATETQLTDVISLPVQYYSVTLASDGDVSLNVYSGKASAPSRDVTPPGLVWQDGNGGEVDFEPFHKREVVSHSAGDPGAYRLQSVGFPEAFTVTGTGTYLEIEIYPEGEL